MCDFITLSVGSFEPEWRQKSIDCLNVMAVNWKNGIAERIGIGIIFSRVLDRDSFEPGPLWREIILG